MTPPANEFLERLNALPHEDAVALFRHCCAANAWADAMALQRPFRDADALLEAADRTWNDLGPAAWRDAFDGHPRIGEKAAQSSEVERTWSEAEQSASASADTVQRAEMTALQRAYELRFGHIFLICATGRSAGDITASLRARMDNDADTERRVAAREQAAITRLRLEKLITS